MMSKVRKTRFQSLLDVIVHRPLLWFLVVILIATTALSNLLASALVCAGVIVLIIAIQIRSNRTIRNAMVVFIVLAFSVAIVAALSIPTYFAGAGPLLVPEGASKGGQTSGHTGTFELSAFVVTDNENATTAVDDQGSGLTTIAATGGFAGADGSFLYSGVAGALSHAHLAGARGELLVQNYDLNANAGAGNFTPELAHAVVATALSRQKFVSQLVSVIKTEKWDGVVIDFEEINAADQPHFAELVSLLKSSLPIHHRLVVSVPVPSVDNPSSLTYDLTSIAKTADVVNLMAYDQHDSHGDPGPVSALQWIRKSVHNALKVVPARKLQLGIAAYGYSWGPSSKTIGASYSPQQARQFTHSHGVVPRWDKVSHEWTATLPDGTVLWWADPLSISDVTKYAKKQGLEGASIWELSISDSLVSVAHGLDARRVHIASSVSRVVKLVEARGLAALTFDDGPDPRWTPQILEAMRKVHVPGTFFVIGKQAEKHPALLRQELADGAVIGSHTYSHKDLTKLPSWQARMEVLAGKWVVLGITGRSPVLFRSPYGANELADTNSNEHRQLAASLGLLPVGWNVDTMDWQKPGVSIVIQRAISSNSNDIVILLHDGGGDRSQTVAAIPGIVTALRKRGYDFVTIDQLDGSIQRPYQLGPRSWNGKAAVLSSIASFQLWIALHTAILWILIMLGALSIFRIIISWPLAWLYSRRSRTARRVQQPSLTPSQSVAILIPACNEAKTIAKTLKSIGQLAGPVTQVIVAENGSTDGTARVARDTECGVDVIVRELGSVGKAAALNECLSDVTADVIVLVDADTIINHDFVVYILSHFDDPRVGAVAGNVKVGNRRSLLARLQSLEYIISLALDRQAQALLNVISVVPGASGAFRTSALLAVGGWPNRTLTEDTDLTVMLLREGWKIPYESRAISWTEAPETLADVVKQRRRWSYGTTQVVALNSRAVFSSGEGRLGLITLPWLLVSQVLLPAAGPIVDTFLIWLLFNQDWKTACSLLALSIVAEMLLALWALRNDNESSWQVFLVPIARIVWRPISLWAVSGSLREWLSGRSMSWARVVRHNTVKVGAGS